MKSGAHWSLAAHNTASLSGRLGVNSLSLNVQAMVRFDAERAGMTLDPFLQTPQGTQLAGPALY